MATLNGNAIKDTFNFLLKLASGSLTTTPNRVENGSGTQSALSIATNKVNVDGDLEVTGRIINNPDSTAIATAAADDLVLDATTAGMSILSNDTNVGTLQFGENNAAGVVATGGVEYDHAKSRLTLKSGGNNDPKVEIDNSVIEIKIRQRNSSVLTSLDSSNNLIISTGAYLHVYDTVANDDLDKITLPSGPTTGDTYVISNIDQDYRFAVGAGDVGKKINGATSDFTIAKASSTIFICIGDENWVTH